jgi:Tfp pilus assembly protein PilE
VTFVEVVTVLVVIGVLISMSAPTFTRTIEQAQADIAGANLQAVWSAQRFYWLENRDYADDLEDLADMNLLDPSIVTGNRRYRYKVKHADKDSFEVECERINSNRWSGEYTLIETGEITGMIQASGEPFIQPSLY